MSFNLDTLKTTIKVVVYYGFVEVLNLKCRHPDWCRPRKHFSMDIFKHRYSMDIVKLAIIIQDMG